MSSTKEVAMGQPARLCVRDVLIFLIISLGLLISPALTHADKPADTGKDKDKPAQSQGGGREEAPGQQEDRTPPGQADRTPPGQERREEAAANRAERAETRSEARTEQAEARSERAETRASSSAAETRVERQHPHQERQAQARADRGTGAAQEQRAARSLDRRQDQADHGREAAQQRVASLTDSLTRLERARWSYNPHDTRGQGNLGQPRMRDPYGFDRDSDREGRDRGRPIRESEPTEPAPEEPVVIAEPPVAEEPPVEEPVVVESPVIAEPAIIEEPSSSLNLAELVTGVEISDPYLAHIDEAIAWWTAISDPSSSTYLSWLAPYASYAIAYWEQVRESYLATSSGGTYNVVLWYQDPVEYSLALQPFEGMEGTTLQVTTQLVSAETVSVTGYTGDWQAFSTTYETGQVLVEQTQDVTLTQDGTYTLSLDPSTELLGGGFFNGWEGVTVDMVVTITDPVSGASYTMTFDNQFRLVDPYGIVYDKTTGRPIAGATVTVHHADGSIVVLDRSANSNASNPQMTDATGRYHFNLAMGKYYLTVKAPGYEEYRSPLFSEQGHIVREDVGLTPAEASADESAALPTQPAPTGVEGSGPVVQPGLGSSAPALPLR